jgi:spermidine synthase
MTQPWWKRMLSYVMELHIESAPSEMNPHLYVSLRNGRYSLNTANAIYSFEDRYDNFRLLFKNWDFKKHKINKVLILGFGLGSVPIILERYGVEFTEIIGVEKDEEVIYLASKYALPKLSHPVTLVEADALDYIKQCTDQFDLIISDIFIDDVIPPPFRSTDYLISLASLCTARGVVLYNMLAFTVDDRIASQAFFANVFSSVFPTGVCKNVAHNYVLCSSSMYLP